MLFSVAFGVPEKSVFTRTFDLFVSAMLANFQDRLVMTTSITLHDAYCLHIFLLNHFITLAKDCQEVFKKKNTLFLFL